MPPSPANTSCSVCSVTKGCRLPRYSVLFPSAVPTPCCAAEESRLAELLTAMRPVSGLPPSSADTAAVPFSPTTPAGRPPGPAGARGDSGGSGSVSACKQQKAYQRTCMHAHEGADAARRQRGQLSLLRPGGSGRTAVAAADLAAGPGKRTGRASASQPAGVAILLLLGAGYPDRFGRTHALTNDIIYTTAAGGSSCFKQLYQPTTRHVNCKQNAHLVTAAA